MFKKMAMLLFVSVLVLGAVKLYAQGQAVDVGNKICPVTGEKINDKLKVTYEYEGKIYNFCCAGCPDEFKKDPQKYIKKVEAELQVQNQEMTKQEEAATQESKMAPMEMQGSHHH